MLIRILALAALLSAATLLPAAAQSQLPAPPAAMREGVYFLDGKSMRLEAGQLTPLRAPFTLPDGSTISPGGLLIRPNKTRQQLRAGQAVNMRGSVVNIQDDMMAPAAIQEHNQAVTGGSGDVSFSVAGQPSPAAPTTQVQQLLLLERRFELLRQMSNKLDERANQALGQAAGAASYSTQIREIDNQLRP